MIATFTGWSLDYNAIFAGPLIMQFSCNGGANRIANGQPVIPAARLQISI